MADPQTRSDESGNGHDLDAPLQREPNPALAEALEDVESAKRALTEQLDELGKRQEDLDNLTAKAEASSQAASDALVTVQQASTLAEAELAELKLLSAEIKKLREEIGATSELTTKQLELAKGDRDKTSGLAGIAESVENRVQRYEQSLGQLTESFEEMRTRIEGLLPGATSAGLAQSFQDRKKTFHRPKLIWSCLFGLSIVLLVGVAAVGEVSLFSKEGVESVAAIGLGLLHRLPFAGPLVWFAIFAQRRYAEASRLEEDYGYKEAVSRAFEGYKRELQGITDNDGTSSPLLQFCTDVLRTLSLMPGRVFDSKLDEPTPASVLKDTAAGALSEK